MPDLSVGSWPMRRARINPAAIALRQDNRVLSYAELAERVDRVAAALSSEGVGQGDRVAYLGPNDISTFEVFFAAGRLGALFVPINWRLAPPEVAYQIADCTPRVLLHAPEFASIVHELPVRAVPLDGSYQQLDTAPTRDSDVELADDAVILYTSGTTGRPKGAVLTHGNLTFNTMNQLAHFDVLASDTTLCISPLFHAVGLAQAALPTLFKGGTIQVLPKFEPGAVLATIASERIASFSCVPTMLQMMAEHRDFATTDLTSLRYVVYGGSPVVEQVALAWQARRVPLVQGYGMTEAAPGVMMATAAGATEHPVSIGVPHFFTDVAVGPAAGTPLPGAQGELLVRGPNVFRGYWQRPDDTAEALDGGWYHSGDVVRVGDDGWSYVVDRVKDLYISGGENVYPSEIERELGALAGVLDVAVVGIADAQWGEVGVAFVVVSPESSWTPESLRAALTGRLAAFKIPAHVEFVGVLPRTPTGKVRRSDLRVLHDRSDTHDRETK